MLEVQEREGLLTFLVRVQHRAGRAEIAGRWQQGVKIRLSAPAEQGRANEELRRFLAERLEVPVGAVNIKSGLHSRTKCVQVRGTTAARVRALTGGEAAGCRK